MSLSANNLLEPVIAPKAIATEKQDLAFAGARNFLEGHQVYFVISPRAHGLSIGVNMNPDQNCNFDCQYCEVERTSPPPARDLDVDHLADELHGALEMVYSGHISELPAFRKTAKDLLVLRHVALSGDGEPTLCEKFLEVVQTVIHIRAMGDLPFFKMVLITNGTGLDREVVQAGLRYFNQKDEIWIKLDAGTRAYMERVNRPQVSLEKIMGNILLVAKKRPVVIQSLFPSINGVAPAWDEIENYAARLEQLCSQGAQISLVQIYSANRPTHNPLCGHLPLRTLSKIAQHVRQRTGLQVEVY